MPIFPEWKPMRSSVLASGDSGESGAIQICKGEEQCAWIPFPKSAWKLIESPILSIVVLEGAHLHLDYP